MTTPDARTLEDVIAAHRRVRDDFSPLCACGQWRDKRDDGTLHAAHVAEQVREHLAPLSALADDIWRESQQGHQVIREAGIMQDCARRLRATLAATLGGVR